MQMKFISLFTLLAAFFTSLNAQDALKYFDSEKLITPGVFYYPEHWPQSQWERDFENMAKMGFEYVHMGEFAWAFLEPAEGNYQFEWFDKAIDGY